jgi:hypothetical protein
MLRHILIRKTGQTFGGEVMAATATDLCAMYSPEELARLQIGLSVTRQTDGGPVPQLVTHIDLLAFHNRHATPDLQGTTLLRRFLGRALLDRPAKPRVAA